MRERSRGPPGRAKFADAERTTGARLAPGYALPARLCTRKKGVTFFYRRLKDRLARAPGAPLPLAPTEPSPAAIAA